MPDLAVGLDEVTTLITSVYFSDPDGDRLSFRATSNDPSVVRAIATASELVLTPTGLGTATVTVTATDPGGLSASQTFEVTVTATNRQPVPLEPIPDQALPLTEAVSKLPLADYFSDPDGDRLSFRSSSNDLRIVAAHVTNSELLLIPFGPGTATVTVTATDPGRLSTSQTFEVTVTTNNRRPVSVEPIPDQTLSLGGRTPELRVADYFFDPDGDRLDFRTSSNDPSVVSAVFAASKLVLTPIGPGTATVTATATDPGGLSASQTFEVTVTTNNRRPVSVEPIPDQALSLGGRESELRVADYFFDPDGDRLDFRTNSNDPSVVSAVFAASKLVLTPIGPGTATVTVTATDPGGLSASQTFEVTVTTNNRGPVSVEPIPDQTLSLGGRTPELRLADYFSHPDGNRLDFRASSNDPSVVSAVVAASELVLTPIGPGTATVTVTATDPGGLSASQTFEVTVTRANRRPVPAESIPDQTFSSGGRESELRLADYFFDPDGDRLDFRANSNDPSVVSAIVAVSELVLIPLSPGTTTVTVTATDPGGLSASQTFEVAVTGTSANHQPVPTELIPDQALMLGGSTLELLLANYFSDPDGDRLDFRVSSSDLTVVFAVIVRRELRLNPLLPGTATVTVTATDPGGLSASQRFLVTVGQETIRAPATPTRIRIKEKGTDFIEWSWPDVFGADGYEFQLGKNAKFAERDPVSTTLRASIRIDSLESDTLYSLRIRAFADFDGTRLRSSWSVASGTWTDIERGTDPRFNRRFWEEIAFATFDCPEEDPCEDSLGRPLFPDLEERTLNVLLTTNPNFHIRTHNDQGERRISSARARTMRELIPDTVEAVTASPFTGTVTEGPEKVNRFGWIQIEIVTEEDDPERWASDETDTVICGRALVGALRGRIWLNGTEIENRCRLTPLVRHEIGHSLGLFHVRGRRDLMASRQGDVEHFTPSERFHAQLAYELGRGHLYTSNPQRMTFAPQREAPGRVRGREEVVTVICRGH